MPQITLNSDQVNELAAFIKKHGLKTFFMAKDEGAYIGASAGSHEEGNFENLIYYFKGMDPNKDEDAWETARYAFGGDDFGEFLDTEFILKMAERTNPKVTIKVTATSIKMDGTYAKEPEAAAPKKPAARPAAPKNAQKMTKGERIRQLLAEGVDVDTIVGMVGTTANSVRWHKSKMNKAA